MDHHGELAAAGVNPELKSATAGAGIIWFPKTIRTGRDDLRVVHNRKETRSAVDQTELVPPPQ